MTHQWTTNEVMPERISKKTGELIPAFFWFPKCALCGAHVCLGTTNLYRTSAEQEWTREEPPCLK